ncbi:MAG TPA: hypothetical protein VIS49_10960 [Cyclobacteriaceae bacterium]
MDSVYYTMQDLLQVNDQLNRKDLFEAFKTQLAKDFEQSNFDADFLKTIEPDFDLIQQKMVQELQRAEKKADSALLQLLYRIDISESQLKKYLSEDSNQNHLMTIAELIIKRVLQKVVIRHYYKKNKNA